VKHLLFAVLKLPWILWVNQSMNSRTSRRSD